MDRQKIEKTVHYNYKKVIHVGDDNKFIQDRGCMQPLICVPETCQIRFFYGKKAAPKSISDNRRIISWIKKMYRNCVS